MAKSSSNHSPITLTLDANKVTMHVLPFRLGWLRGWSRCDSRCFPKLSPHLGPEKTQVSAFQFTTITMSDSGYTSLQTGGCHDITAKWLKFLRERHFVTLKKMRKWYVLGALHRSPYSLGYPNWSTFIFSLQNFWKIRM